MVLFFLTSNLLKNFKYYLISVSCSLEDFFRRIKALEYKTFAFLLGKLENNKDSVHWWLVWLTSFWNKFLKNRMPKLVTECFFFQQVISYECRYDPSFTTCLRVPSLELYFGTDSSSIINSITIRNHALEIPSRLIKPIYQVFGLIEKKILKWRRSYVMNLKQYGQGFPS